MKKAILALFLGLLAIEGVSASLTVIDFEDLVGQASMPSGYAGLNWDTNWFYWDWSQDPYNPSSGNVRIATHNYGGWMEFNGDVDFEGAYLSGGYGTSCYFEGYKNGALVGTSSSILMSSTPTFLDANFASNVDKVNVVCDQYNYFAVDDVTFERAGIAAPEIGSVAVAVAILLTAPAFAYLAAKKR